MPFHLAILSRGDGWHFEALGRAARARGMQVSAHAWTNLWGREGGDGAGVGAGRVSLGEADAVLLRTVPPGSLEQIVFRMDLLDRLARLGVTVVNAPKVFEVAVDKYLALARLAEAGLPVPETVVSEGATEAMAAFDRLGGDVVVKPLFGAEGFGLMRVGAAPVAARIFQALEQVGSVIYQQRYVDHDGSDRRLMVVGGRVVASMRRRADGWPSNLARGGRAEPFTADPALAALAAGAAAAIGAEIAGVDLLWDRAAASWRVLEVNGVPGWRGLATVSDADIAGAIVARVREVSGR